MQIDPKGCCSMPGKLDTLPTRKLIGLVLIYTLTIHDGICNK